MCLVSGRLVLYVCGVSRKMFIQQLGGKSQDATLPDCMAATCASEQVIDNTCAQWRRDAAALSQILWMAHSVGNPLEFQLIESTTKFMARLPVTWCRPAAWPHIWRQFLLLRNIHSTKRLILCFCDQDHKSGVRAVICGSLWGLSIIRSCRWRYR